MPSTRAVSLALIPRILSKSFLMAVTSDSLAELPWDLARSLSMSSILSLKSQVNILPNVHYENCFES